MNDSKSIRANELDREQMSTATNGASRRAIRKYSRDQLFDLAKSLDGENDCSLEFLRHADRTQYQIERQMTNEEMAHEAQLHRKLNRQTSDLNEQDLASGLGQHRKLYRMTSSPSIKCNGIGANETMRKLDGVSSQVRAKYARLIETMSNGASQNFALKRQNAFNTTQATPRNHLIRTNSHQPTTSQTIERPAHLFGPLRRQHQQSQRHEGRRDSAEEPMSLPYSININGPNGSELSRWTKQGSDEDQVLSDETPIKRISANDNSNHLRTGNTNGDDDDDFDITNLLSITVLSDIRTIRQDLQTFGRQTSNLSRSALSRSKSNDLATRMPVRSKTTLDFQYSATAANERNRDSMKQATSGPAPPVPSLSITQRRSSYRTPLRSRVAAQEQQQQYFSRPVVSPYEQLNQYQGSESLPYDWRATASGLFVANEMAPSSRLSTVPPTSMAERPVNSKKPVDERVAKIIETFKAQVKARALANEAPIAKVEASKSRESAASDSSKQINSDGGRPNETRSVEVVKKATQREETKEKSRETEQKEQQDEGGKVFGASDKQGNTLEQRQQISCQTISGPAAGEPEIGTVATEPNELDNEGQQRRDEQVARSWSNNLSQRTSNIPRLISLYRVKSNQQETQTNKSAQQVVVAANVDSTSTIANVKQPDTEDARRTRTKFVSQYKLLRGKSLADEVDESAAR